VGLSPACGLSPKRSEESEIRHLEPPQACHLEQSHCRHLEPQHPRHLGRSEWDSLASLLTESKDPVPLALPSDPERHSYHVLCGPSSCRRIPPPGLLERNRMLEARTPSPVPPSPSQKSRFFVHALERTPMRKISAAFPLVKSAETCVVALNANPRNLESGPGCDIKAASVGDAATVNLTLVLLLLADSWFDSKLGLASRCILPGRTGLAANRISALWVKPPAVTRWILPEREFWRSSLSWPSRFGY
jgi:hypothetical protein